MNYYISDWHYNHSNILAFDNRPYLDVKQMNRDLIARWNDQVGDQDTVYILGDMFWKPADAKLILPQLKGDKILIQGNHDVIRPEAKKFFQEICDYKEIVDGDKNIILCHYPIIAYKNSFQGWYHFYGHVHTTIEANMVEHMCQQMFALYGRPHRMFNVGAMMPWMDYTPQTADHIINFIAA